MQIKEIQIENYKNIKSFSQYFNGGVYLVRGDNEFGKTSLISAIMSVLTGERSDNILKEGEEAGFVSAKVGERYELELRFTENNPRGTLSIKDTETGMEKKNAKTLLQSLFQFSDFDANEFVSWSETAKGRRKQVEEVKSILPKETRERINEIEEKIPEAKEKRKDLKKTRDDRKGQLSGFNLSTEDLEKRVINVDELKKKKEEVREELNRKYQENKAYNANLRNRYEEKLQELKNEIDKHNDKRDQIWEKKQYLWELVNNIQETTLELRGYLKHIFGIEGNGISDETITKVKEDLNQVKEKLPQSRDYEKEKQSIQKPQYVEEMPDDSELQELDKQLEEAYEHNQKVKDVTQYKKIKGEVDNIQENIKKLDTDIENLEKEKAELIQNADLPIEGLTFSEDGLKLNGIPVKTGEISTSQAMELAFAIATEKNKNVKVFKIAQGESLGTKKLQQIVSIAEKNGFQGFIERVSDTDLTVEKYYEKGTEPDRQDK